MREAIYRINTVRFNLDKILEQTKCIYSDRKQISGFLDCDKEELTTKGHK